MTGHIGGVSDAPTWLLLIYAIPSEPSRLRAIPDHLPVLVEVDLTRLHTENNAA